jgi:hypothetical protein
MTDNSDAPAVSEISEDTLDGIWQSVKHYIDYGQTIDWAVVMPWSDLTGEATAFVKADVAERRKWYL